MSWARRARRRTAVEMESSSPRSKHPPAFVLRGFQTRIREGKKKVGELSTRLERSRVGGKEGEREDEPARSDLQLPKEERRSASFLQSRIHQIRLTQSIHIEHRPEPKRKKKSALSLSLRSPPLLSLVSTSQTHSIVSGLPIYLELLSFTPIGLPAGVWYSIFPS